MLDEAIVNTFFAASAVCIGAFTAIGLAAAVKTFRKYNK